MKKLDQYLLLKFWSILGLSIIGFISIFIIVDLIENIDRFIDNHVPFNIILKYYFYTIPWFINIGLPMSVLISTIFSLGTIIKENEWTAMKAAGISLYRISSPIIFSGFVISGCSFILDNKLVSFGNEKRFEIDKEYVKRKSRHKVKDNLKNIFLQKNNSTHATIEKFSVKSLKGSSLTLIDLKGNKIRKRIDSKDILWRPDSNKWLLSNYSIRNFSPKGIENKVVLSKNDTLIHLGFSVEEIKQQAKKPDELDFYQLSFLIKKLKSNGIDTLRWEVSRYLKISFSFTNLIVMLFGIPLTFIKEKNSLSFGIGMSILIIFCYYALIKFGQSLGYNGLISPILSSWVGNIVFIFSGLILFFKAKT